VNARLGIRILVLLCAAIVPATMAWSEYADVIINSRSESEGVAPVIFPHWFHRVRFQCSVCHVDLGIQMKAGANGISMEKIIGGEYCGACHDGVIAWSVENCDLCHSGRPGLETGIKGGHRTAGPGTY
jgi:c(7)-type cytochrome triheme protein